MLWRLWKPCVRKNHLQEAGNDLPAEPAPHPCHAVWHHQISDTEADLRYDTGTDIIQYRYLESHYT